MTDKTRVIRTRLPNEVADWINTIKLRQIIEWLYGAVKSGEVYIRDNEVKFTLLKGVDLSDLEDLRNMAVISGGTLGDLITDLQRKLDNCEIGCDEGHITL